jgi:hypothetical protein
MLDPDKRVRLWTLRWDLLPGVPVFFKFFWQWVERLVTRLSKHRKWSRVHLMEEIKFAYALPSNTDW